MARWIVPAGTETELTALETQQRVLDGEIVYNTDNNTLQLGFVDILTNPSVPVYEYRSVGETVSTSPTAPVAPNDGDLWYFCGSATISAGLYITIAGQWIET